MVVKSACQYIAMVALTKSGLDRLVHITWEVRMIEEQKVLLVQSCSQRYWQEEELCQPSLPPPSPQLRIGRNSLKLVVWLLTIQGLLLLLHLDKSS